MQQASPHTRVSIRLIYRVTLIFLIVLGLALVLPLLAERREIQRLEEKRLQHLTETLVQNVVQELDVLHYSIETLRQDLQHWLPTTHGQAEANRRLGALSAAIPGLQAIRIIDANGQSWAAHNPEQFETNNRNQDDSQGTRLWVQKPLNITESAPAEVRVTQPDTMPQPRTASTIELLLDGNAFRLLLTASRYNEDTEIAIASLTGTPLAMLPNSTLDNSDTELLSLIQYFANHPLPTSTHVTQLDLPNTDNSRIMAVSKVQSDLTHNNGTLLVMASRGEMPIFERWWFAVWVRMGLFALICIVALIALFMLRRQEKREFTRQQLFASFFSSTRDGILITDKTGAIVDTNAALEAICGYSREELLGQNPRIFQSGRHTSEEFVSLWQTLQQEGHWSGELWNRHKNGAIYPARLTISAIYNNHHQIEHYAAILSDITTHKEHEAALERLANNDPLTGLLNRRGFTQHLNQVLTQHKPEQTLVIVFVDLDGFKQVNDQYGHDIGDELLQQLSTRFLACLPPTAVLARLGGDEFIAIYSRDNASCLMRSEKLATEPLLQAASAPLEIQNYTVQVSASIGIVSYPFEARMHHTSMSLLRAADQAMYEAKAKGKNQIVFLELSSPIAHPATDVDD